ncbi:MAG: hypothetical protein IPM24_08615 [Bryobacterales bacterium]|nr:hypothetical protein [Bryobacterales bacterium]
MAHSRRPSSTTSSKEARPVWCVLGLLLVWLAFYGAPLFSPQASIQWDAADVHYASQQYLASELGQGRVPFWTPYLFSGFPFLADPQVGAFYPLNWPFLAAGAGPRAIQAEIALHGLLALCGAYFWLLGWIEDRWAALAGAMAYGLSGFFVGHASHVGMVQAGSWLPWILLCADRALRVRALRWTGLTGAAAGMAFLTGHLQTALYAATALALYLAARSAMDRTLLSRAAGLLAATAVLAFCLSGVMTLPGLELSRESVRAQLDISQGEGSLDLLALATLARPNALGAFDDEYRGPGDVTQYYFYAGVLLLPLAALGAYNRRLRWTGFALAVPALLYMLGPAWGFYKLVSLIPPFDRIRGPVHAWFVVALALAWFAAAGAREVQLRLKMPWAGLAVAAAMALDLLIVNSWTNPLLYARSSFEQLYGGEQVLRQQIGPALPPGMRFSAPNRIAAFGPMNSPLQARIETTYGYNPLELLAYHEYREAAGTNPKLLDALSAALVLDVERSAVAPNAGALPRAWFPEAVRTDATLATLDPAREAWVAAQVPTTQGEVLDVKAENGRWTVRWRAPSEGLLVLSLPWYPGWSASAGGRKLEVLRVNHALSRWWCRRVRTNWCCGSGRTTSRLAGG